MRRLVLVVLLALSARGAAIGAAKDGVVIETSSIKTNSTKTNSIKVDSSNAEAGLAPRATNKVSTSREEQAKLRLGRPEVARAECDYEKEVWQACQANGLQQRTLRLKAPTSGSANSLAQHKCQPIKIMQRECMIGCKYTRGEWSTSCLDGLRVRVDTLISKVNIERTGAPLAPQPKQALAGANSNFTCQPERRVTKDCKRACHYIKSAWSECAQGFKTRNLTLDETPLVDKRTNEEVQKTVNAGAGCAKQKQVKRECGVSFPTGKQATLATSAPAKPAPQTPAQKRRVKQLQRQQKEAHDEKELQQTTSSSQLTNTTR